MFAIRLLIFMLGVFPALADGLPPDAAVDANSAIPTLVPKVTVNSGILSWVPYNQDLTPWITLSHLDARPALKPRKVAFKGPLNGDPARGHALALSPQRGCVICHEIQGEEWSGSIGPPLLRYGKNHSSEAELYQRIYDVRINSPYVAMPAFGTMDILSDQDIRDVIAYLESLE